MQNLCIIGDVFADHNSHVLLVFCCNSYKRLCILSQRECQEIDQLYFFNQEGMKNWKFHVRFRLTLLLGWLGGGSNFKLCIIMYSSFMLKKTQFLLTETGRLFIVWTHSWFIFALWSVHLVCFVISTNS